MEWFRGDKQHFSNIIIILSCSFIEDKFKTVHSDFSPPPSNSFQILPNSPPTHWCIGWPWTPDPPVSTSWVLGLHSGAITTQFTWFWGSKPRPHASCACILVNHIQSLWIITLKCSLADLHKASVLNWHAGGRLLKQRPWAGRFEIITL